eukprot:6307821-Pyramimonas_sp.AAC.1
MDSIVAASAFLKSPSCCGSCGGSRHRRCACANSGEAGMIGTISSEPPSVCLLAVLAAPRCGGCEVAARRWPRGREADLAR